MPSKIRRRQAVDWCACWRAAVTGCMLLLGVSLSSNKANTLAAASSLPYLTAPSRRHGAAGSPARGL